MELWSVGGSEGGGDSSQGTSEGGAEVIGAPPPGLSLQPCDNILLAAELWGLLEDWTGEEQYRGAGEGLHP